MNARGLQWRDDDGATAVVAAVVAVLLFGVAALAVDLTNLYTRDRSAQTNADLAAFAGGQSLPESCAASAASLAHLNDDLNRTADDGVTIPDLVTAPESVDSDLANGEIVVRDASGGRILGCSDSGRSIRVVTPDRRVQFIFASAFNARNAGSGSSAASVQAAATVTLTGALADTLPVFVPAGCVDIANSDGLTVVVADGPGGNSGNGGTITPTPTPTSTPTGGNGNGNGNGGGNNGGGNGGGRPSTTPTPTPTATATATATATVSATPAPTPTTTPACPDSSTGDFGFVSSPNLDASGNGAAELRSNFKLGVDHSFEVLASVTDVNTLCPQDGTPAGALIDDTPGPAGNGANCLRIEAGSKTTVGQALITDVDARLKSFPAVRPTCNPPGGLTASVYGDTIWNATPSCYLAPGMTLANVRSGDTGALRSDIWRDPRFFIIPETYLNRKPGNNERFLPIKKFHGAFITNAGWTGGGSCDTSRPGGSCNGISFNGRGGGLDSMTALIFPLDALPPIVDDPTNGAAFVPGRPGVLLLTE